MSVADKFIDRFSEEIASRLNGWVINNYSRYDPTHVDGLTPTGKTFTLDIVNGTATLTVAGRTRTAQLADGWEDATKTVDLWLSAYNALPVNQR